MTAGQEARTIYSDIMDDIDPYRQGDDETTIEAMLYNLECIRDDIEDIKDYFLYSDIQQAIDSIKAIGGKYNEKR